MRATVFVSRSALFLLAVTLGAQGALGSAYDTQVLSDRPALYLTLGAPHGSATEANLGLHAPGGRYFPATSLPTKTKLPNGDVATVFDGYKQYLEVASAPSLSVRRGHALTIEAWIRPDTLEFPSEEGDGYVHWLGKGESGQQEYVCRMYSRRNSANRPSRISGYAFNPQGGLGSGSYFQDRVRQGEWIHVAVVIDAKTAPGTVAIFKNGVLRKTTSLAQYHVVPTPGEAPFRVATRDFRSFFKGAIGKVAVYSRALAPARLVAHFQAMK